MESFKWRSPSPTPEQFTPATPKSVVTQQNLAVRMIVKKDTAKHWDIRAWHLVNCRSIAIPRAKSEKTNSFTARHPEKNDRGHKRKGIGLLNHHHRFQRMLLLSFRQDQFSN